MVRNTLGADINEILTGYYLLNGNWDGYDNPTALQSILLDRKTLVPAEEYKDQDGRAQAMATAIKQWATINGYEGNAEKVWWTARGGILAKAYGKPVDSKKNPTDILVQFSSGQFLGISAKSSRRSTRIAFKNPGLGSIEAVLSLDLSDIHKTRTAMAIKEFGLPLSQKERKKFVRAHPDIQTQTQKIGNEIINKLRDVLNDRLNQLTNEDFKAYLLTYWLDADAVEPRYIKVTGAGRKGSYTAAVVDPLENEKLSALSSGDLEAVPVGTNSVGILANTIQKIMRMRFKYESEKLCSSIKLSGDPW